MAPTWKEVQQATDEKRCELILSGPVISKRIQDDGLDSGIFRMRHLNFLEISKTALREVPDEVGELTCLTRVIFRNNELQKIPQSIGNLKKLKFVDLSFNCITELPESIGALTDIQSLNFSNNKLSALPCLAGLVNLVSLNISNNSFTEFPADLCDSALIHFSELVANNNGITSLPSTIGQLTVLKVLNLGDNALVAIPGELGDCTKVKELNLKGNKLKDKRLVKLIEQCHVKQVMEYVRAHCPKSTATEEGKQSKSKKKSKQQKKTAGNDEVTQLLDAIKVLHVEDDTIKVVIKPSVKDVRPYIVCCVMTNVNFKRERLLKKFITMQTKLHESVCEKRTVATIATHDLSKIEGNIFYEAKDPNTFTILPLNRKKELSAAELYAILSEEADALRKEKKKNTYSGIHKYLYLLKDKPLYPCLSDSSGRVISFPPITNSDVTKVSEDTTSILVEVTGNNLATCKKVLDSVLEESVALGIGEPPNEDNDEVSNLHLSVQQLKVVDEEGQLKVVYPSRTDIQSEKIHVIRC